MCCLSRSRRRWFVVAYALVVARGELVSLGIVTSAVDRDLVDAGCVAVGDVLGLGGVELVVASGEGIDVFSGSEWVLRIAEATNEGFGKVILADVDGDDDLDVVSSGPRLGFIRWHENPSWVTHIIAETRGTFDILALDVDGDSKVDVVEANFFNDKVAIHSRQNDSWTETVVNENFPTLQAVGICVADIDGDQMLDVAAVGGDAYVSWFSYHENTWRLRQILGFRPLGHDAINCVDVDGDNDIDFVVATTADDRIDWHENKNLTWTDHLVSNEAPAVQAIDANVDINEDGIKDIFSANFRTGTILWFHSSISEDFEMTIVQKNLDGAACVLVADVDSDSLPDIVGSGRDAGVKWSDLTLVPAPSAAPTVTPAPSLPPTIPPSSLPTRQPTSWHPYIPTPQPTKKLLEETSSESSSSNPFSFLKTNQLLFLAILIGALFLPSFCLLRWCHRRHIRPCLFKYEPYYGPKIQLFWKKWKRSRLRNCLCCCCPKCCKSPADEDPLHPYDAVKVKPGEAPVRVVTGDSASSSSSSGHHLRFLKTGRREITIIT